MRKLIASICLLLFLASCATVAAETIVFEGTPDFTSTASPEQSFNSEIKGEDKINYKLMITKDGSDYFWFSRDKKKLNHIKSGAFEYFIEPNGAGYIKITKEANGKYLYMESMSMLFKIITYWGVGNKIEL